MRAFIALKIVVTAPVPIATHSTDTSANERVPADHPACEPDIRPQHLEHGALPRG